MVPETAPAACGKLTGTTTPVKSNHNKGTDPLYFSVTPAELNTKLTVNRGFTDSGLLIWKAVRKVTGKKHAVVVDDHPTHAKLDAQLAKGNPIIAKVLYENRIWHWILISGKDGTDYLMHDPLGKGTPHEPMTRYSAGIFTIRYLK